ncbi:Disulfide-bond oxidoreductase YghU (GSH-dependent disulfide-bond oxidoreductase YghU) (GST N2-2) (Organic hydroperoxidase), partial [Durusdinium trenchii]
LQLGSPWATRVPMADAQRPHWVPPSHIEDLYNRTDGNQFAGINQPTAGPRYEAELPKGSAPLQLYSLATPNGWKIGILLEELGVSYDAHVVNIGVGEQFSSGFVGANPNSKIPALIDHEGPDGSPMAIMESVAMMLYLAEKCQAFYPSNPRERCECLQWLFWQVGGQGPMTGNFGHFKVYAPSHEVDARNYGVARYGMEVQRLCSVLDRHLAGHGDFSGDTKKPGTSSRAYLVGDQYSIADMACFPWAYMLWGKGYNRPDQPDAKDFLGLEKYVHLKAWVDRIAARPAVQRGIRVCAGSPKPWLKKDSSKL